MSQKKPQPLTERQRFSYYLRTGRIAPEVKAEPENDTLETKFNPYHDPENGRFTFAPGGPKSRRSVVTSWGKYKPKAVKPKKPHTISGRRLDVPIPPAQPIDPVPTERRPDGSITVDIPSPSEPNAPDIIVTARKKPKAYSLSQPDIVLPPKVHSTLEVAGAEFERRTGKKIVVNSGPRSPYKQAEAMYIKFQEGSTGQEYRNRAGLNEVRNVYVTGRRTGKTKNEIIKDMESVISDQVKRGTYLSRHLKGGAVDLRIINLSNAEIGALEEVMKRAGGKVLIEKHPPHIHVEF